MYTVVYCCTMSSTIVADLLSLPGIGIPRAMALVKSGVKSTRDLAKRTDLPEETMMYLKYPVMREIPWEFADRFVKTLPRGFEVLGSYRRKRPIVHDIDIVTTMEMAKADALFRSGSPPYTIMGRFVDGDIRSAYIVKYEGKYLHVDLFHTDEASLPAAMLHWTGSVTWNIRCRRNAKLKGYKLNEKGLYDVKTNSPVKVSSEKDILDLIGVKWRPPEEREK